jgi:hypothetical protein
VRRRESAGHVRSTGGRENDHETTAEFTALLEERSSISIS